jgi:hypothetical protein
MKDKITDVFSIGFRVDTPALLHEIANSGLGRNNGVLKVPLNVFIRLLERVAERAIQLDDPELNICMLSLNLYEVPPMEVVGKIEEQIILLNGK